MVRIFLSYRSLDRAAALAFERAIVAAGYEVFLDCLPERGIAVGDNWERRVYDELYRSEALVPLVSAAYIESQWCFAELAIARARGLLILPVALAPSTRHPLLGSLQHVDGTGDPTVATDRVLARLRELNGPGAAAWNPDRSPYAGLEPFDVDDAAVFFGRSQETANLVELVTSSVTSARRQPVFVTGASGCGKSSLVRAGLIPALARRGGWLSVPPVLPGESPIDALAFAVVRGFRGCGVTDFAAVSRAIRDTPSSVWRSVAAASVQNISDLLIVVDQFEDLFRPANADAAHAFIAVLDDALKLTYPQVSVVATLRSDAVGRLPSIWSRRAELVQTHVLSPLRTSHLAEVIREPARVAAMRVPDELVSTLVEETGDGTALPFLSFVLRQIAKGVPRGGELTLQRYRQLGGVKGALSQEGNRALVEAANESGLSPQRILELLTDLVALDDEGRPLRRRRRVAEGGELGRAIAPFVDRRLLVVHAEGGEAFVDVAHEALFDAWRSLADAIQARHELLELRRQVERDAATWQRASCAPTHLWSGKRAGALVSHLADLTAIERDFVNASMDAASAASHGRADAIASQLILTNLAATDPESAVTLALAVANEIATTPRVVRCLNDALMWHGIESLVREIPLPGVRTVLVRDEQLLTVSTDVEERPITSSLRQLANPPREEQTTFYVRRWPLDHGPPEWTISVTSSKAKCVGWGPREVALGMEDGGMVFDADTGLPVSIYRNARAWCAGYGADEPFVRDGATRSGGGAWREISPWNYGDPERVPVRIGSSDEVRRSLPPHQRTWAIDGDGGQRAVVWGLNTVAVWRLRKSGPTAPVEALTGDAFVHAWHSPRPHERAISPGGRRRFIEHPARILDLEKGAEQQIMTSGPVAAAAFSANGRWLGVCADKWVALFDADAGEEVARVGTQDDAESDHYCSVSISDNGKFVAAGTRAGTRSGIWSSETGERLAAVRATDVAIDPQGRFVVASTRGEARVVTIGPGVDTPLLRGVTRTLMAPSVGLGTTAGLGRTDSLEASLVSSQAAILAISPDGTRAALATNAWTMVCDMPSGEPMCAWRIFRTNALVFSSDGRTLGIRNGDSGAIVSIPSTDDLLNRARAIVTRAPSVEERARFGF